MAQATKSTTVVTSGWRLVLPKDVRSAAGIKIGTVFHVSLSPEGVVSFTDTDLAWKQVQDHFAPLRKAAKEKVVDDFLEEKKLEAMREDKE